MKICLQEPALKRDNWYETYFMFFEDCDVPSTLVGAYIYVCVPAERIPHDQSYERQTITSYHLEIPVSKRIFLDGENRDPSPSLNPVEEKLLGNLKMLQTKQERHLTMVDLCIIESGISYLEKRTAELFQKIADSGLEITDMSQRVTGRGLVITALSQFADQNPETPGLEYELRGQHLETIGLRERIEKQKRFVINNLYQEIKNQESETQNLSQKVREQDSDLGQKVADQEQKIRDLDGKMKDLEQKIADEDEKLMASFYAILPICHSAYILPSMSRSSESDSELVMLILKLCFARNHTLHEVGWTSKEMRKFLIIWNNSKTRLQALELFNLLLLSIHT